MMLEYLLLLVRLFRTVLCSRSDLVAENRKRQNWNSEG
jgi:hypothetical protein